jgi:hypothetical protein
MNKLYYRDFFQKISNDLFINFFLKYYYDSNVNEYLIFFLLISYDFFFFFFLILKFYLRHFKWRGEVSSLFQSRDIEFSFNIGSDKHKRGPEYM